MRMEVSSKTTSSSVAISFALIVIITWAWRLLDWVWFRPKKLERYLKQQNLNGKPYRLFFGDLKENAMMFKQALSKPLDLYDVNGILPRALPLLHHMAENYGKNTFIWIGPLPRVIIFNPEDVREVYTRMQQFHMPTSNPIIKLLASGLVSLEGEEWANHRKIIMPAFHVQKLKQMIPIFSQCCDEMIIKWEKLLSMEECCELDVWPYLQNFTSDVISRTAFGSSYKEGERIFNLLGQQTQLVIQLSEYVYLPGFRFLPTKTNKRMKEIDQEIRASLKVIIGKKEKAMKEGEATAGDLLGTLIESNFKEIQEHGNKKKVGLSNKEVIDECKLFYFAGQQSTTAFLVWTMILLAQYPNWQARAREEVLQAFGNSKPDFDGLNRLEVLTMILYEVLRLYPPVAGFSRKVVEETKLGNLLLPAGIQVFIPTLFIHHDQQIWGDDACDFKPERFSKGIAKATKNRSAFIPFGLGPRICVGQNFTLLEAKVALATILQKFSFDLSPSYVHAPLVILTLQPQHGAQIILHKY